MENKNEQIEVGFLGILSAKITPHSHNSYRAGIDGCVEQLSCVLSIVKEEDTCCFGLGCSSSVSLYFWPVWSDRLINNALYNPHRQWPNEIISTRSTDSFIWSWLKAGACRAKKSRPVRNAANGRFAHSVYAQCRAERDAFWEVIWEDGAQARWQT